MTYSKDESFLLPDYPWRISYRTSTVNPEDKPTNILHEFYIPALRRAVRYDRVAGYFRSSSLAAASQGFSAFTAQNGKARFIVGADLDPDDVHIILQAVREEDHENLALLLGAELEEFSTWPENIQNGVALLGWMVKKGILELKVACRIHAVSGEPV
ncbi:hypothetical protein, partial [Desulfonatronospira sp.]|uniref:hypothetical protein n=1 Tax=Desulfonatronospira sp. TaxID=1962951 RepID=UPI0025BBD511